MAQRDHTELRMTLAPDARRGAKIKVIGIGPRWPPARRASKESGASDCGV